MIVPLRAPVVRGPYPLEWDIVHDPSVPPRSERWTARRHARVDGMRIGVEVSSLVVRRTGVGHYIARLLRALLDRDDGQQYELFSHTALDRHDPCVRGASVVDAHLESSRWIWMQTALPRALAQAQVDVCHFTNSLAPLWQPAPGVVLIHDASVFLLPQYHTLLRRLGRSSLLPAVARRSRAIVTLSETSRAALADVLGISPEKIHVVHGAAPPEFGKVQDEQVLDSVREKYSLPSEFILTVGTLEPRKNLARLVRAWGRLRRDGYPHKVVLVGPPGWHMHELEKEVSAWPDDVIKLGYVPTKDLPPLYSLATVFAYPSLYEGFGLPAVEAMACGTPVLAGNRGALPEVCGDAASLVDPMSDDELTESLRTLLDDQGLRQGLRARGLERARRFAWARSADQMVSVYETAAGSC
jgi:glycosyltransferase involved in cell wall biosynthesis